MEMNKEKTGQLFQDGTKEELPSLEVAEMEKLPSLEV